FRSAVALAAGVGRANAAATRAEAHPQPDAAPNAPRLDPAPEVIDAGPSTTANAPAPWELVRPLTLGAVVAQDWRVAELRGAVDGSCVLTLQNARGRTQRVHLCRNDGRPQGVVHTRWFDLGAMTG